MTSQALINKTNQAQTRNGDNGTMDHPSQVMKQEITYHLTSHCYHPYVFFTHSSTMFI